MSFVVRKVYERNTDFEYVLDEHSTIKNGQRILILEKKCYELKILFDGKIYYVDLTTQNWRKVSD